MNCPQCGISLADSFSTCPACGAPQTPSTATPKARVPKASSGVRKRSPKTQTSGKTESTAHEEAAKASERKPSEEKPAERPEKEEAAEKPEEGSETKGVPLRLRLRRGLITWLVVFALGFAAEKVVDFAFQDGPRKLAEENRRVSTALAAMHPSQVAINFYTRLAEPHGWRPYQWDAPFNAAEAERKLDAKYQQQASADNDPFPYVPLSQASLPGQNEFMTFGAAMLSRDAIRSPLLLPSSSPNWVPVFRKHIDTHFLDKEITGFLKKTAITPVPKTETPLQKELDEIPLPPQRVVSPSPAAAPIITPEQTARLARQQERQAAYNTELDKINHTVLPKDLQFGKGGVMSTFVGGALGLLDAYMFALRVFLPHTPPVVLIALVSVGMALTTLAYSALNKETDGRMLFLLLLLLPFGISVIGWLLWELGEGTTLAFKSVLTAPMLNVVSTSAATPVVAWFSSKAAEHSLVERALEHDVIRRLMGLAGKVE